MGKASTSPFRRRELPCAWVRAEEARTQSFGAPYQIDSVEMDRGTEAAASV